VDQQHWQERADQFKQRVMEASEAYYRWLRGKSKGRFA
jgi:hypothetical protein